LQVATKVPCTDKRKKTKANENKVKKGAIDAAKLAISKQCAIVSKAFDIVGPLVENSKCFKDEL
jgi:hypothetical protein